MEGCHCMGSSTGGGSLCGAFLMVGSVWRLLAHPQPGLPQHRENRELVKKYVLHREFNPHRENMEVKNKIMIL